MATLYCLPSDILTYAAAWSRVSGANVVAAFPFANQNDVRIDLVTKFDGTAVKVRGTIASTAIQAAAIFNSNGRGLNIAVTNNNSMASQNLPISTTFPAGSPGIHGWKDLRTVTTAATQWDFDFPTHQTNVTFGKIYLIGTLRTMPLRWSVRMREIRKTRVQRTGAGVPLGGKKHVRWRELTAKLSRESARGDYTTLRRASAGPLEPFFFVLEEGVNDPMPVWFPQEDWTHNRETPLRTEWTDLLEELSSGNPLS